MPEKGLGQGKKPWGQEFRPLKYATEERNVFLGIDLVVGSAALWLPIGWALLLPVGSVTHEMNVLFHSGAPYAFALAFLSASTSFLYLDRNSPKIKDSLDKHAGAMPFVVIGVLALGLILVSGHVTTAISESALNVQATSSAHSPAIVKAETTNLAKSLVAPKTATNGWSVLNVLQGLYLILAIYLAVKMFCIRHFDKVPDEFKKIEKALNEKKEHDMAQAKNTTSFPSEASLALNTVQPEADVVTPTSSNTREGAPK